jgi:LacI family transcriptional regulator
MPTSRSSGGNPTIRDVAQKAGVSVGTVSRVLNRHEKVGASVRRQVESAIEELNYEPNVVAQSMRNRSTMTIGCIIREISIPPLAAFVRAAHNVLDEAGFSLLISNSEGRLERERELLKRLSRRQIDGVMIGPYSPIDESFEEFLRSLGVPIVLVDRDQPAWVDAVMTDHASGVRAATEHLIDLGHKRIALLTGATHLYPARERIRGYELAFQGRGLKVDQRYVSTGSFLASSGFSNTSSMLIGSDRPTAIIAGGLDMLPGVIRAVRVRGLGIPEDISIVAATDSELAELHTPGISVQRWDQAEVGRAAADLLLDRIYGRAKPAPRHVLLPNEFYDRASTAPPPANATL